jgi:hypothetical protein
MLIAHLLGFFLVLSRLLGFCQLGVSPLLLRLLDLLEQHGSGLSPPAARTAAGGALRELEGVNLCLEVHSDNAALCISARDSL